MQTAINFAAPAPVCVTAFITPRSLVEMPIYSGANPSEAGPAIISVGAYMSDHSITRLCNFTNAANALNYAFLLKTENCPISKHAFALLRAEIKRSNAVSTRAKLAAEAKQAAKAEQPKEAEPEPQIVEMPKLSKPASVMKQHKEMKKKHPDALLLFRLGDFYELIGEDAVAASEILGITLTRRANGKSKHIELAGFPHHALDKYLPMLVRAGKRVAICEQLDEPKKA